MNVRKLFGTIIGIIAFIILIAGATFAWYTWTSNNTIVNGTTGCFTIDYIKGTDISAGSLIMSSTYSGGLSATVTINISSSCSITGTADIILTTNVTGTTAALLAESALKYAVYQGATYVNAGTISATGALTVANDITLTTTATAYTVYVWLDGSIADNEYVGYTYSGYISASAQQTSS